MFWDTLPNWIWIIFYLFLLLTLVTAILGVIYKNLKLLSAISIVLTITIPFIGVINSIGRGEGVNEFEYLISQLQVGSIWAVYVFIGLLYLFVWWGIFLVKLRKK